MRSFIIFILLFCATIGAAQSGRVNPQNPNEENAVKPSELSAEQLFEEANSYTKTKFTEFQTKKVPYSEKLRLQTIQEQKQLAAKNAAIILTRTNLTGEDFYFLGMLHWIAENNDGAQEAFKKFTAGENPNAEKLQAARAIIVILAARKKDFDEAEKILAEYLNTNPTKPRERTRMENELTASYRAEKNLTKAAAHAEEAFRAVKTAFQTATSRAAGLDELLGNGLLVFEIYRDDAKIEKADKALEDLQKTAVFVTSTSIYYTAVNERMKYYIETGRKPLAMQFYKDISTQAPKDFQSKSAQDEISRRLKRREKHYQMLGEIAPELPNVDRWFPGDQKKLVDLRGKVVILEFWATWCGPCLATFPTLIDLNQKFEKDGLVILGITRYYGEADGEKVTEAAEIEFLQEFKKTNNLPYDFIVGKDLSNQITYDAMNLPTTVIIDRKGIVRYAEIGTGRETEVQKTTEKLLAER